MTKKKTHKFFSGWTKKILILVFLLTIFLEGGALLFDKKNDTKNANSININANVFMQYAEEIVAKCKDSSYHPSCYDKEIPKLMDAPYSLSMENTFAVTKLVQNMDQSYQYCHLLGHALSAREVKRDPSKWKEVVARCPSGVCSNGCIHGGFQEKFRKESLTDAETQKIIPDLKNICEEKPNWHPTGLEQSSCYHAVGHLTMYIAKGEVQKAINLCNVVAKKDDGRDFAQLCYDGVFMQIFQPLEPEDIALVKGKQPAKQTLLSYCNNYKDEVRSSCISESWPLFKDQLTTSQGIIDFCAMEKDEKSIQRCYGAVFYILTAQFNLDINRVEPLCNGLPSDVKATCFTDAASRFIETDYKNIDKAVKLCEYSADSDPSNECYRMLVNMSRYNFHVNSPEFFKLCNALPSKWKTDCLRN